MKSMTDVLFGTEYDNIKSSFKKYFGTQLKGYSEGLSISMSAYPSACPIKVYPLYFLKQVTLNKTDHFFEYLVIPAYISKIWLGKSDIIEDITNDQKVVLEESFYGHPVDTAIFADFKFNEKVKSCFINNYPKDSYGLINERGEFPKLNILEQKGEKYIRIKKIKRGNMLPIYLSISNDEPFNKEEVRRELESLTKCDAINVLNSTTLLKQKKLSIDINFWAFTSQSNISLDYSKFIEYASTRKFKGEVDLSFPLFD